MPKSRQSSSPIESPSPRTSEFLTAARDLGDRLVDRAIWYTTRCTWTADEMQLVDDQWALVHVSVDASFYSGASGVARFLTHLWQFTQDDRYLDTAIGALRQSWALVDREQGHGASGLFTGALGIACVSVEAGRLLGRDDFTARGLEIGISALNERVAAGRTFDFDLIHGIAGALVASAYLATAAPTSSAGAACSELAAHLIASAQAHPWGLSWPDPTSGREGMCGLAHGASGAALALLEAWRVTGDPRCRDAAGEALRYEYAWFDQKSGDWHSQRPGLLADHDVPSASPPFWCHGSSGIGLARVHGYQITRDPTFLADAAVALRAASQALQQLREGHGSDDDTTVNGNYSVCHGACGPIELALCAAEVFGQPLLLERARLAMRSSLALVEREGGRWRCGVPGGDEHPGLMLGLAGIGLCLLRLHAPLAVPPVTLFTIRDTTTC